jgi:OOP family OmpA-OmpF porin
MMANAVYLDGFNLKGYVMKKLLFTAMLGIIFSAPMAAQAEGGYFGISAGKAKTSSDVNTTLATVLSRSNGVGGKIDGGYQFNPYFGVEAGYANLGASKDTYNTGDVFNYHFTSYYLAATGTVPMGPFSLFGKFGLASNRIAGSDTLGAVSVNFDGGKLDAMGGLGAGFNFNKNFGMRLEYEYFGNVSSVSAGGSPSVIKGKGQMLSLGLQYNF